MSARDLIDVDLEQAVRHINFIASGGDVTFQTFDEGKDSKDDMTQGESPRVFRDANESSLSEAIHQNLRGQGVFIVVNETDGKGRKAENITKVRFVFCDLDEGGKEKLARIMADEKRPPHAVIESSPGKFHVYWRVDGSVTLAQFPIIQKALAAKFGGDPAVCDLPRTLRVAGLLHNKGEPVLSRIVTMHEDVASYSVADFTDELVQPETSPACPVPKKIESTTGVVEGGRNDAIFKLACQLRVQGVSQEEAKHRVLDMALGCHPPLSEPEAMQCLESAWRYKTEGEEVIAELNAKHAKIMVGASCYILREEKDPATSRVMRINLCRLDDMCMWFSDRTIAVQKGERQQTMNIVDYWLKDPRHRRYEGIVFAPGKTVPGNVYNLWQGPAVVSCAAGSCDLFLGHLFENIADSDTEKFNYILDWMADAVQNPAGRPGVAIVLLGDQGVGKSIFADQFGKLFGQYYVQIASSRELTGNFNAHLEGKLLVFYDEASCMGDRHVAAKLKALITERTLPIERKGRDILYIDNYIRLILASNDEQVIPAALDERRYFTTRVGNKHQGDRAYFEALINQMESGGRENLMHLLLSRDLSGVNLCDFPKTTALLENKLGNMEPVFKWWYGRLVCPPGRWPSEVCKDALYQDYLAYCLETGERQRIDKSTFGKKIKKLVPTVKDVREKARHQDNPVLQTVENITRKWQYQFPSQQECRRLFEALVKQSIDWGADQ